MPAIVENVNVNNLSGILNVGDVYKMGPSSFVTTFAGSGSFNSGKNLYVNNGESTTYVTETPSIAYPDLMVLRTDQARLIDRE